MDFHTQPLTFPLQDQGDGRALTHMPDDVRLSYATTNSASSTAWCMLHRPSRTSAGTALKGTTERCPCPLTPSPGMRTLPFLSHAHAPITPDDGVLE